MILLRHVARATSDLTVYAWRTGRWWLPLVTIVLAIAAALVVLVQTAVPTAVYTLF